MPRASLPRRPSLRERRKIKTRKVLIETARHLFLEQGYEKTTLEQICDQAEVSVATCRRYFESKVRLALYTRYRVTAEFREELAMPEREDTVTLYRRLASGAWFSNPRESGLDLAREADLGRRWYKLILATPELSAGVLSLARERETMMAGGLSRDAGVEPETDLYSKLLAATLDVSVRTAFWHWVEYDSREEWPELCLGIIDFVLESFPERVSGSPVHELLAQLGIEPAVDARAI